MTKGLGAGANPEVGRQAALEDRDRIAEVLEGSDMVFITAGMGGGTGTGGAPIVASVAKEMGILTVAVVTRPFPFEGRKRLTVADQGLRELQENVDSLITIPNDRLLKVLGKDVSLVSAFAKANDVLYGAVSGIADLIIRPGMINVDFADVRTVMSEMGMAMMGTGVASGDNRATEAAEKAVRSPLLDDIDLVGARGILVNISAGPDLSLGDFSAVGATVEEFASEDATVVIGTVIDENLGDELRVTVVATGLSDSASDPKVAKIPAAKTAKVEKPAVQPTRNYKELDVPTSMRAGRGNTAPAESVKPRFSADSSDYLDIPAFLRKQAD